MLQNTYGLIARTDDMAGTKRPARRIYPRSQKASDNGQGSTPRIDAVGEVPRGTEYNAILKLALPKTTTVKDTMYTPEDAERITRLRHERWNLLAAFSQMTSRDSQWKRMNDRMTMITKELYELTGHEIYNG